MSTPLSNTASAPSCSTTPVSKRSPIKLASVAIGVSVLAACTTPAPPPPPPPPPPPVVESVPYRPLPPGGAAYVMQIPPRNALGVRETINTGRSDDESIWQFRSSWNVAALNCTQARFTPILTAYSAYIDDHGRALRQVNDRVEAVYRRENGGRREGLKAREEHMTSVYNFFALPPARASFCNTALDLSNRYLAAPVDPIEFARSNFALMQQPFEDFFVAYEAYQRDSAAWDARYGAQYGPSQPGWVAVQEARARGVPIPTVTSAPATTLAAPPVQTGLVADSETGAEVPVIPTETDFVSQPVVEPVPTDSGGGN